MLKKIIFTVLVVFISFSGTAQNELNDYKYIIVPKTYDFLKTEDKYQLNSLTKFLFNKYGFEAYLSDEDLPDDLKNDRCMALTSEVSDDKSGMFKTKLEIILKDCFGKVIMTSEIGESLLKKYDRAYTEALRSAFVTFQNIGYKYELKEKLVEVKVPKTEIKDEPVIETEKIEISETKVVDEGVKDLIIKEEIYYAQAIEDGYQLVDSEPKIIMILLSTSAKDVFMVKDKNAIVYKDNEDWVYYENNGAISKRVINIKF
ncbi:hypothetical protein [Winogradskyella sp. PG-2]|uniref:hypothetical protein n=1 Tax=Winogradskyella sp. PG-2 TaxID=754409 RepID=UPI0004588953|nr:hypothetical protein [Winogradskyella sp. PG-2]BAO74782.1 hypothetical protein WPG_0552 [Winogradskyella sp. PG-2]